MVNDRNEEQEVSLLLAVQSGQVSAYGRLYERHAAAARLQAGRFSLSTFDIDDLVSDAFTRVFAALRVGRGPTSNFRAYLLTTLRHAAYTKSRQDRRIRLVEDMADVFDGRDSADSAETVVLAAVEAAQLAKVFVKLSDRWRMALWRTEVEGRKPADIARKMGLSANGAAALVSRARAGLRRAYLGEHQIESLGNRRSGVVAHRQVSSTVA
ncbi:sigma-70 family RNA polymerase sigma factor [Actinosynnema sp. NPDC047251]|uniref:RNA polymerase sigma-70 region 2 domain-containing protein n=1 Tax=Saccharothrix espanaensis (strain ATCC 51144 / DSM 44229 / JCM 9112 / NBRC 15066 / NRRL 15764) TaxID=1179773 RepID=K0JPZ2_SACES|nr:sigma-70 family RNA polymerase sigma factor [Saccharothrix espanaensis]CCH29320.1 hypothetical protein BN6_19990 [Saccharothrix espanaensis DSM 44229]